MSRTKGFTLLVKPDRKYAINGEVITERGKVAVFRDHVFRTSDPEIQAKIEGHDSFGTVGSELWSADAMLADMASAKARNAKQAIEQALEDPKAAELLKASFGKTAFVSEGEQAAKPAK